MWTFFLQWTLIAGRVKTILGLALNYYSIQRVLCDGVGAPSLTARCQLEIELLEKQFDECMVFLMRVSTIDPSLELRNSLKRHGNPRFEADIISFCS